MNSLKSLAPGRLASYIGRVAFGELREFLFRDHALRIDRRRNAVQFPTAERRAIYLKA